MVFGKLFRRDEPTPAVPMAQAQPQAPSVPFVAQMEEWLDRLDWYERECSAYISTSVYSRLRNINDLLRQEQGFLANYDIRPEEEYLLRATLTQYIPESLTLFNRLPEGDRQEGGQADQQLLSQCDDFQKSVVNLLESMADRVQQELGIQTAFVRERFSSPV